MFERHEKSPAHRRCYSSLSAASPARPMSSRTQATFLAPSSLFEPSFWEELYRLKLNVQKLDSPRTPIDGLLQPGAGGRGGFLSFSRDSLAPAASSDVGGGRRAGGVALPGVLINVNTIEEFRAFDKKGLLNSIAADIYARISACRRDGSGALAANSLFPFVVLSFADLKAYTFTYWCGFPAITQPLAHSFCCGPAVPIAAHPSAAGVRAAVAACNARGRCDGSPLVVACFKGVDGCWEASEDLMACWSRRYDTTSVLFALYDSGCGEALGWQSRNLLAMLSILQTQELTDAAATGDGGDGDDGAREVCLVLLRGRVAQRLAQAAPLADSEEADESMVCHVTLVDRPAQPAAAAVAAVGWESNDGGRAGPRVANMSAVLDKTQLMAQAVDLNLKLMKWRLWPDLQVESISGKKCLLLGAGTLGCAVARALLGWGVRCITLVDSGRVSYSNPTRQCLFSFEDAAAGTPKAVAAAAALRRVYPQVRAEGRVLSIPMPGHPLDASEPQARAALQELQGLVQSSDVVFLLTDSREARWLPTLLCAYYDKIAINAALGFDSYLVMRHGHCDAYAGRSGSSGSSGSSERLGCYFCSDVVAATNSQRDRSLDQQCTVTRPGLSFIAAALAVELMVAVLQSPLQQREPARGGGSYEGGGEEPAVPHQVRGGVRGFGQRLLSTACFDCCTACGHGVLAEYHKDPFAFLKKVCADSSVLEEVSGIAALTEGLDLVGTFSDSDED